MVKDQLVLVNRDDEIVGYETKEICHSGIGKLHRAFSILIFTTDGRLLLQKRSAHKGLWPLYWSTSVCSHPRKGEKVDEAARRRLREELGIDIQVHYLYTFHYYARYFEVGSESEMCSVFFGVYDGDVTADPNEIDAIQFVPMNVMSAVIRRSPELFTPWFRMEWDRIVSDYVDRIRASIDGGREPGGFLLK